MTKVMSTWQLTLTRTNVYMSSVLCVWCMCNTCTLCVSTLCCHVEVRGQPQLLSLAFHLIWDTSLYCLLLIQQVRQSESFRRFSWLWLPSYHRKMEITGPRHPWELYVGSRDSNSCSHACLAIVLLADPSLPPSGFFKTSLLTSS